MYVHTHTHTHTHAHAHTHTHTHTHTHPYTNTHILAGEMPLALELITEMEIHWDSKTQSLQRLSSSLELPFAAMVFVDDNPGARIKVQINSRQLADDFTEDY